MDSRPEESRDTNSISIMTPTEHRDRYVKRRRFCRRMVRVTEGTPDHKRWVEAVQMYESLIKKWERKERDMVEYKS